MISVLNDQNDFYDFLKGSGVPLKIAGPHGSVARQQLPAGRSK